MNEPMLTMLNEEQVEERTLTPWGVDEPSCQRCGRSALDCGAASDPAWFIDTELVPNESVPDEPIALAVIFCPACW
jgi:hypothetical protein